MLAEEVKYPKIGGKYKHYKGGTYEVITLATHSETQEAHVVYQSLLFGSTHTRPLYMWFEVVGQDKFGHDVTRFKEINSLIGNIPYYLD